MSTLGQRIRYAREAKGITQASVAKPFNIARNNVSSWESDDTRPSQEKLTILAQLLDVKLDWLMSDASEVPSLASALGDTPLRSDQSRLPDAVGGPDLPVFASAEGGEGVMVVNTDPLDYIARPPFLKNVRDGYAVLVSGTSMEPAYEAGEMVLVNPRLPLVRGKDIILVSGEERGEFVASIKRYMGQNAAEWLLRQFNPPEGQEMDFRRFKHDWPKAMRVVGKYIGF